MSGSPSGSQEAPTGTPQPPARGLISRALSFGTATPSLKAAPAPFPGDSPTEVVVETPSVKFNYTTKWADDPAPDDDPDAGRARWRAVGWMVAIAVLVGVVVALAAALGLKVANGGSDSSGGSTSGTSGSSSSTTFVGVDGPPPADVYAPPGGGAPPAAPPPPPGGAGSCPPAFDYGPGKGGLRAGEPALGRLPDLGPAPFEAPDGWAPLWWDEFDGAALDPCRWRPDRGDGLYDIGIWGWGNDEMQYYSRSNVAVADGSLAVTARKEVVGDYRYTSGRVSTFGKASFYPGMPGPNGSTVDTVRIEARAKAPAGGPGLWAALWMEPEQLTFGKWAGSGEIDIFELKNDMSRCVMGVQFGGAYPDANQKNTDLPDPRTGRSTISHPQGRAFGDVFSVVRLDWKKDLMTFYIDGVRVKEFGPRADGWGQAGWYSDHPDAGPTAPFGGEIPFHFTINLAVGGRYPGDPDGSTVFPNSFEIDWLRVYGK